jgi:hypothetical protein
MNVVELFIILMLIAYVSVFILPVLAGGRASEEQEDVRTRPQLSGDDLQAWIRIHNSYASMAAGTFSAIYSGDIDTLTWDKYEELTGKEQWARE